MESNYGIDIVAPSQCAKSVRQVSAPSQCAKSVNAFKFLYRLYLDRVYTLSVHTRLLWQQQKKQQVQIRLFS